MGNLSFHNLTVGDEITSLTKTPTNVQLFRFSAITWNAHRIHYDKDFAKFEGYPDILVQAHLHGSFLSEMIVDWLEDKGVLKEIEWQNRKYAIVGETLTCKARVKEKYLNDDQQFAILELLEQSAQGNSIAIGKATVQLFY
jgi:hydroxyacyl-ACP dehydratase HTD2-like protein with hotdog domain